MVGDNGVRMLVNGKVSAPVKVCMCGGGWRTDSKEVTPCGGGRSNWCETGGSGSRPHTLTSEFPEKVLRVDDTRISRSKGLFNDAREREQGLAVKIQLMMDCRPERAGVVVVKVGKFLVHAEKAEVAPELMWPPSMWPYRACNTW